MATSAQVILSLGIGRSAAPAMKYMEPYRYITPTRLIGRHGPDRLPMDMTTHLEDALKLPDIDVLLGGTMSLYVGARPSGEPWWMGYSVEVSNGGWLLLKAEVIKETITDGPAKGIRKGAIKLDFLARKEGTHDIMVSLYGPNLDSASATYH
ncbi:hypothetical protein OEA41_002393 [Lepraria neglecta]|uniref:Uncharacterized protein n=1 Tax=Lepraria neglecta TaxID=209136 RepID=A0AAD9ZE76_9LECA|nr:hypothetical protein OEA41_002393 [Lepraria neglecta]